MPAKKGNQYAALPKHLQHLRRRVYHNARYEEWFCDWLDSQSNRGRLIQAAVMKVHNNEIISALEREYYEIRAANSHWEQSLWDFLLSHGITQKEIWQYSPQIGYDADQPEPNLI